MNADIYGLRPRSSVRKRRMRRRLRTIAALVVLAVIWLSFSVVRQFAAERQASTRSLPEPMAGQTAALKPRVASTKVALHGFPPPSALDSLPAEPESEPAPADVLAGAPFVIAPVPELENTGRHVPFLQASLNNGGFPGGMHRGNRGFNGGMGGFGGGGFGGGSSAAEADATAFDATGGDERVGVMGRRAPAEIAADDPGSNGNHGEGNNGSNGNHGDGNNGSNGNHGDGNNGSNGNHGDGNNGANGNHGSKAAPDTDDSSDPPAGDSPEGPVANDPVGDESAPDARPIPEPGSILLAFGATAAIARHRRRRG